MCLYTALAFAACRAAEARATGGFDVYDDLCPDWGPLPSRDYRFSVTDTGMRSRELREWNTDATIFDPRVWTDATRRRFCDVLKARKPRVVLISTVSAAHRYALEMAALAKREAPGCLVVLGGRHVDETVRLGDGDSVELAFSSPVSAIADGRAAPVVDILVSGDGPFALDVLLRAISRALDLDCRLVHVDDVVEALEGLARDAGHVPGTSAIVALRKSKLDVFPIRGRAYDLEELPSPYRPFAIRARFSVFADDDGRVPRTAHFTTTQSCSFRCSFCSESVAVTGRMRRYRGETLEKVLSRLAECIHYGAEAVFFDDSVLWGGNFHAIEAFASALERARETSGTALPAQARAWLTDDGDVERLRDLRWGGQLTIDLLTTVHPEARTEAMLDALRRAGCTYIYIGIESMADVVMASVQKNIHPNRGTWPTRVRNALELVKRAGITVGSSVMFGLDGESRATIDFTIDAIGELVDIGLLDIVSPNLLTYHPAAAITHNHRVADELDYHSQNVRNRPPYAFFEEAYPSVVSRLLCEDDVWHIHRRAQERWGARRNAYTEDAAAEFFGRRRFVEVGREPVR